MADNSGGNAMLGVVIGGIIVVLLVVFLFGGFGTFWRLEERRRQHQASYHDRQHPIIAPEPLRTPQRPCRARVTAGA